MAMRLIEIFVPQQLGQSVQQTLKDHKILGNWQVSGQDLQERQSGWFNGYGWSTTSNSS